MTARSELARLATVGLADTLRMAASEMPRPSLTVLVEGRIVSTEGSTIRAHLPETTVGMLCRLSIPGRTEFAEIVGFDDDEAILAPLGRIDGISRGSRVMALGRPHAMRFTRSPLGTIFDGFGRVIGRVNAASDGDTARSERLANLNWGEVTGRKVVGQAPDPTTRPLVARCLETGVRAIDGLTTIGHGQRIGIFAGPGSGKTTLMAALARNCRVDAVVFALIGERGRELREFLERAIPPELASRAAVVCATSDRTALERSRAAATATTIAEALRDRGLDVLLLVDSVTRFARAQRDVGIAAGESVTRGGFTPSVYSALPGMIERAGTSAAGTITAVYTVLVEGDLRDDPLADEMKSLLDGHIVLSADLAQRSHYPAIDVLASLSRLQVHLVDPAHLEAAERIRRVLARHRELEFLIRVGEFQSGADAEADHAVRWQPDVMDYLQQDLNVPEGFEVTLSRLRALAPELSHGRDAQGG